MIPRRSAWGQILLTWSGPEEPTVTFLLGIFQRFRELRIIQLTVIQSMIFHFSLSNKASWEGSSAQLEARRFDAGLNVDG